jgi:lantibiotic protection ABC transporter MutE/EpiE family permease subunit
MLRIILSEYQKQKRTFTKKTAFLAPIIIMLLCLFLSGGGYFQAESYNWWYTMFLPGSLSLICAGVVQKDKKKLHYRRILSLPVDPQKIWFGKIGGCVLLFLISCFIFLVGITLGGAIFGNSVSFSQGATAVALLFLTFLWQIPFCMILADRWGQFAALLINLTGNIVCVVFAAKGDFWWIPFAVPTRLMCPVIHILPNGLAVPANDPLLSSGVILPGVLITLVLFCVLSLLTALPYRRLEAK